MGLVEVIKSLAGIEEWDFSDRRGTLRIPCKLEGKLSKGDDSVDVEIVDIGLRGLRVLVLGKVRKRSVMELSPRGESETIPVKCRIEWKKDVPEGYLTGVSFRDSEDVLAGSWLFEELRAIGTEAMETKQRRTGIRVICNAECMIRVENQRRDATLIDLGLGGALIEHDGDPLPEGLKLKFSLGPIDELSRVYINSEVVVHYDRDVPRYGLKFDTFSLGGVTDLERYLTYFYALSKAEEKRPED